MVARFSDGTMGSTIMHTRTKLAIRSTEAQVAAVPHLPTVGSAKQGKTASPLRSRSDGKHACMHGAYMKPCCTCCMLWPQDGCPRAGLPGGTWLHLGRVPYRHQGASIAMVIALMADWPYSPSQAYQSLACTLESMQAAAATICILHNV